MSRKEIELQYEALDYVLMPFVSAAGGAISRQILFGGTLPPHYDEVLSFLVQEGGFLRKYRRELRNHRLTVVGAVAAIASALLALITLYLQYCR